MEKKERKSRVAMKIGFVLAAILLCNAGALFAQGFIITEPLVRPGVPPVYKPLEIRMEQVETKILNGAARTTITQIFYNPSRRVLEGTYYFPLPKDAVMTDFSMVINGKETKGETLDAKEARRIYEEIVRRMKDPGILEYMGNNLFRVRVYPIMAQKEQKIEISYSEILPFDAGIVRYRLPMNLQKIVRIPLKNLGVRIDIQSKTAIKSVYSPTHKVEVDRKDDHRAVVGYEGTNVKLDRDFILYYTLSDDKFGLNLLTHKPRGEDGYFLVMISPEKEIKQGDRVPKDIVFIVDTSGSMQGEKIKQAKEALKFGLRDLHESDRFNIVRFSTGSTSFARETLVTADSDAIRDALKFVDDLRATGGTNIDEALQTGLGFLKKSSERLPITVFLTDGLPTVGDTDPDSILSHAKEANKSQARIFVFGVGYDVNTNILDRLAEQGRAVTQYVEPDEDLEVALSSLFSKISRPVLTGLELTFDKIETSDTFPRELPDLFHGSQVIAAGRYSGSGKTNVALTGNAHGKTERYAYSCKFPKKESENEFVAKIWAQRKVAHLLQQIRQSGEKKKLVEEVTELGKKFGIVTPYTSFLVVDESDKILWMPKREMRSEELQYDYAVPSTGKHSVRMSKAIQEQKAGEQVQPDRELTVQQAGGFAFEFKDNYWRQEGFDPATEPLKIKYDSNAYYQLVGERPDLAEILAIGKQIIFQANNLWVQIGDEGLEELSEAQLRQLKQ